MNILIILNNYFHDVATAVPLSSAMVLYVMGRRAACGGAGERRALARIHPVLSRFVWGAAAWIVVGGIPRAIFFTRFERGPAVVKGIVPALIVKLSLMVAAVVVGALMWKRMASVTRFDIDNGID